MFENKAILEINNTKYYLSNAVIYDTFLDFKRINPTLVGCVAVVLAVDQDAP